MTEVHMALMPQLLYHRAPSEVGEACMNTAVIPMLLLVGIQRKK